jgi:hypothetical protein
MKLCKEDAGNPMIFGNAPSFGQMPGSFGNPMMYGNAHLFGGMLGLFGNPMMYGNAHSYEKCRICSETP